MGEHAFVAAGGFRPLVRGLDSRVFEAEHLVVVGMREFMQDDGVRIEGVMPGNRTAQDGFETRWTVSSRMSGPDSWHDPMSTRLA